METLTTQPLGPQTDGGGVRKPMIWGGESSGNLKRNNQKKWGGGGGGVRPREDIGGFLDGMGGGVMPSKSGRECCTGNSETKTLPEFDNDSPSVGELG